MKISELIKKIREEHSYSFGEMGNRIGFSKGMAEAIEKERSPVSKNVLESLVKSFPIYENELIEGFLKQNLPDSLSEKVNVGDFEVVNKDFGISKIKVHDFISGGSGKVDIDRYNEVEIVSNIKESEKIIKNGFVVNILGSSLEPLFFENDKIVFMKEKFENWELLDSKLILVEVNGETLIRKLFFEGGEPFLYSFNDRMYPKIKVTDTVKYLGILTKRLEQDLSNLTF